MVLRNVIVRIHLKCAFFPTKVISSLLSAYDFKKLSEIRVEARSGPQYSNTQMEEL